MVKRAAGRNPCPPLPQVVFPHPDFVAFILYAREESNPQPMALEATALPIELLAHRL